MLTFVSRNYCIFMNDFICYNTGIINLTLTSPLKSLLKSPLNIAAGTLKSPLEHFPWVLNSEECVGEVYVTIVTEVLCNNDSDQGQLKSAKWWWWCCLQGM